jgi:DNA-binding NtrC family response regulator
VDGSDAIPYGPIWHGAEVLVVDDDSQVRQLTRRTLEEQGFRVTEASDGEAALRLIQARAEPFDLVLTDLSMPGASGMDFARSVLDIRPEIPVIMTTGYIDPDDLDRARRIGVREVILKPTTIEEMGRSFHRQLSARQQR